MAKKQVEAKYIAQRRILHDNKQMFEPGDEFDPGNCSEEQFQRLVEGGGIALEGEAAKEEKAEKLPDQDPAQLQ